MTKEPTTSRYTKAVQLHRVIAVRRENGHEGRIEAIEVQEPDNETTTVWSTEEARDAMVSGTDAFFVVGLVWSPVTPWPYNAPTTIKTVPDAKPLPDDLENLPTF